MANITVIGETGQVASAFKTLVAGDSHFTFVSRSQLDLAKPGTISNFFSKNKPDLILNLAAYTQVDKAESEREIAYAINAQSSEVLAGCCKHYFYVSTDYVYGGDGKRPYLETDPVAPLNYYGETKLAGEILAQKSNPNTFVIRTSWVYSAIGVNFVKRMAELGHERTQLKVVNDQVGSPTWAPDLAKVLKLMVEKTLAKNLKPGVYNYSNEGQCSWYDLAVETLRASGSKSELSPIPTSAYPTPAKRPAYSVLDKSKIKSALGIQIPNWLESFEECKKILF